MHHEVAQLLALEPLAPEDDLTADGWSDLEDRCASVEHAPELDDEDGRLIIGFLRRHPGPDDYGGIFWRLVMAMQRLPVELVRDLSSDSDNPWLRLLANDRNRP